MIIHNRVFGLLIIISLLIFASCNNVDTINPIPSEWDRHYEFSLIAKCEDNLCILPNSSISLNIGERENIFIKVKAFADEIRCEAGPLQNCDSVSYRVVDNEGVDIGYDNFILLGPGFTALEGHLDLKMYSLNVREQALPGIYNLTLSIYSNTEYEISRFLTIEVR